MNRYSMWQAWEVRGAARACACARVVSRSVAGACAVLLAAFGCQSVPHAPASAPLTLHVSVAGVQPGEGFVRCAVYADEATFLKPGGILHGESAPARGATAEFAFTVPAGRPIVVSVFQDMNANEQLDRGMFGMPSEPWGFSGAPSSIGPPQWSACAITPVADADRCTIVLRGVARR